MSKTKITLTPTANATEGGNNGSYLISLSKPAPANGLKVNFNMAGNAKFNIDYKLSAESNITTLTNHSFTIAAGETSAILNVTALTDNAKDINETATLNLKTGRGYQFLFDTTSFTKTDYATGSSPYSVSTGDFNNDGRLDLAVTNFYSNSVSVLLRNSTNTGFDTKTDYATGSNPISVSTGDFNGDGKLDLAVTNYYSNSISVLLRNSTNTGFDAKTDYAVSSNPISVKTGDFNNDGKVDLVVANHYSHTVSVLLRNDTNTGFDKTDYTTGYYPRSVSAVDINNDGKLDLAVANHNSNTVSVLLRNTANTGFDAKVDYATGKNPISVSIGDFNGDGKVDLAVANYGSNTVSVLLRNAANTGFDTKVDYKIGFNPFSVSNADVNNDGRLDLVVARYGSNTVSVLLRNSDNTGFEKMINYVTGSSPYSVSTGDFNKDGKLDLVTANFGSSNVSVLTNTYAAATLIINNANVLPTGAVAITGVVTQKQTLTVTNTLADVDGLGVIKYQWLANGVAINNAHKDTYKPTQNEVGKTLTVTASYTDKHGNAETVTSPATTKVINVNDAPTGTVTINDNTPETGQVLTVSHALVDADGLGTINYAWLVDNKIVAIDTNKYIVSNNDANKVISVVAGYIDRFGSAETISSANTHKVIAVQRLNGTATADTINGGDGKDSIQGAGGKDLLNGNGGNDSLDGGNGSDKLNGGSGNDLLISYSGNDKLNGGGGNDTLDGSSGNDKLKGGNGNDSFTFNSIYNGIDKITDFSVTDDTIQLNHQSFTQLLTGVLNADNLVIGESALDNNDYIIYNPATGALSYDSDAAGSNNGIQIALMGFNLNITNADFIVI